MLYLIGLGLGLKDVSVLGLETIKKCEEVYLDSYTSFSNFSINELEEFIGKKITSLNRKQVEEEKPFLKNSKEKDIALLVYGDPLSATTHLEFLKEAKIIHAPSIFTVISETGLSLYKFGKVASIPFWQDNFKPESFFDILEQNQSIKAHTLFLLDLDPSGNKFLTIKQATEMLLEIANKRKSSILEDAFFVGCAKLGSDKKVIKVGAAKEIMNAEFGSGPHCLIIPGELNFVEEDVLNGFK